MSDERRHPNLTAIDIFLEQWPGAEYGPAHIVLSDYNLDDDNIESALNGVNFALEHSYTGMYSASDAELEATKAFLRELQNISEDDRFSHE